LDILHDPQDPGLIAPIKLVGTVMLEGELYDFIEKFFSTQPICLSLHPQYRDGLQVWVRVVLV
jgi:hypothetical protein